MNKSLWTEILVKRALRAKNFGATANHPLAFRNPFTERVDYLFELCPVGETVAERLSSTAFPTLGEDLFYGVNMAVPVYRR